MLFPNLKLKTYAFVGPSGTGKSYRAQYVANESGIKYIIDDGLLIYGNRVIAGESAKKAPTKIATVRNALFEDPEQNKLVQKAIKKYKAIKKWVVDKVKVTNMKISEQYKYCPFVSKWQIP